MDTSLDLALKKLAKRSYSSTELKQVLLLSGIEQKAVESVIEKLLSWGYLNDVTLAQELYEYYTQKKPCGPLLLIQKLRQKGLPENVIKQVMTEYDEEKETEIAFFLSKKFLRAKMKINPFLLARHLQRKGFNEETIQNIINSAWLYDR